MLKRTASTLAILALVLATGCAHSDKNGGGAASCPENGALKGAAIGGLAGAGIGSVIAHAMGRTRILRGTGLGFLGGSLIGSLIGAQMEASCLRDEIARLQKERDDLAAQLKACQDENGRLKAEIDRLNAELAKRGAGPGPGVEIGRIVLMNDVLFRPGSNKLSANGRALLDQAAAELNSKYAGQVINIEGHTDTDPIRQSGWKSNWELGAGRALTVLHYLEDNHGIQGNVLSATTFAFHKPVADNSSSEGKAKNRRSEIVIYTKGPAPAPVQ